VDFIRYAEASASLVNTSLESRDALVDHLTGRAWLQPQCTDRDASTLRRFQRELRPVFEASGEQEAGAVITGLNDLMEKYPITPMISDHDDHLHLHVATRSASVSELLIGESLLGLATLVCDLGPTRLGVCAEAKCDNVYVDTSPNQSRRYCSDRCSSRANVAAYRARQRDVVAKAETPV
jgi:hypothetical protein